MKRFLSICAAAALGVATLSAPAWADENVQEPVSAPESTEQVQSDPEPEIVAESPAPVDEVAPAVVEEAPVPQVEVAQPVEEPITSLAAVVDNDYVLALWKINATAPDIWPGQTLADSVSLDEPSLDALDDSDALTCGTRYQVDLYNDSQVTTALLAGGVLNGPSNPAEDLANGALDGNPWKYLTTADCPVVTNSCVAGNGDTSTNLNDLWGNIDTRDKGHSEYIDGALHVWTEDSSSQSKVSEGRAIAFPLASTGTLDIDADANPANVYPYGPGLNLFVNFGADGNGTLVYEGVYGQDLWLTNGSSAAVKAKAPSHTGGNGSENHGTINEWLSVYPDAQVTGVAYTLGSGVQGDWNINSITVNCATYLFDHQEVVVEPTSVTPSWSYSDACGVDNDEFFLGDEEGIEYQYDGEQYVTVRALALFKIALADGSPFVLNEDGTATLDVSPFFTDEPCATETPTPTPSVTPTETPSATPTVAPVVSQVGTASTLAATGSDGVVWMIFIAALLIVAGFVVFLISRRSVPQAQHSRR